MKKIKYLLVATLVLLFFQPLFVIAQDTIYFTNGKKADAKVLEVKPDQIQYKLTANPNGPLYTTVKSGVRYIVYLNGFKEEFSNEIPLGLNTTTTTNVIKKSSNPNLYRLGYRIYADGEYFKDKAMLKLLDEMNEPDLRMSYIESIKTLKLAKATTAPAIAFTAITTIFIGILINNKGKVPNFYGSLSGVDYYTTMGIFAGTAFVLNGTSIHFYIKTTKKREKIIKEYKKIVTSNSQ